MNIIKEVITNEVVKFDEKDLKIIFNNMDLKHYIIENNINYFDNRGCDLYDDFINDVVFSNFDKDQPIFERARNNKKNDYNILYFINDVGAFKENDLINYVLKNIDFGSIKRKDIKEVLKYVLKNCYKQINYFDVIFNKKGCYNSYHNTGIDNINDYKNMIKDVDLNFDVNINIMLDENMFSEFQKYENALIFVFKNSVLIDNLINEYVIEKLSSKKVINLIDDVILLSQYIDDFKNLLSCEWFIEYVFDDMIANDCLDIDLNKFNELTKNNKGA